MPYAPAANTWDVPAVVTAAATRLRLDNEDGDTDALERAAVAACAAVDVELDVVPVEDTPETPTFDAGAVPTLVEAAARYAAELYQGADLEAAQTTMRAQVRPWRARFGVA